MQYKIIKLIYILLIVPFFLLISCSISKIKCPSDLLSGNPGSIINSHYDELNPIPAGNEIYYIVLAVDKNNVYLFKKTVLNNDGELMPSTEIATPMLDYSGWGTFCLNYSTLHDFYTFIYAAYNTDTKKRNSDLFEIEYDGSNWINPRLLTGDVNSKNYESHPAISADGSYMIFVSDRNVENITKQEQANLVGETDLFISYKNDDGSWKLPENLGNKINTPFKELSPFIDSEGNLYFASEGYSAQHDFNIIKAKRFAPGKFDEPRILPAPINSEYDELFPMTTGNYIFVSSNRIGGCGGFDIYQFPNCGPAYLQVNIKGEAGTAKSGLIKIFRNNNEFITSQPVYEDGFCELSLPANSNYIVKYFNSCFGDYTAESTVHLPCSDTSTVKAIVNFTLPKVNDEFSFKEYLVPFFVSGYYLPNTLKNLQSLRMKFSYNLIGTSDSTRYIENPGDKYDEYAPIVEKALNDAIKFVIEKLRYFDSQCSDNSDKLVIEVSGYADPRTFSDIARYDGSWIDDNELDYHIQTGAQMNNKILSELRAYYTAKHIQNMLWHNEVYQKYKHLVIWIIGGKGIDEADKKYYLKRRVNIKIGIRRI